METEIIAGGKVTTTCRGIFVALKEDHPAPQVVSRSVPFMTLEIAPEGARDVGPG